jgi:hypothetical protein
MSKKSKTLSYVLTLPLKYTVSDEKALEKYFELSRKLYNAILDKTLKRFNLMRQSKIYQQAKKEINKNIKFRLFSKAEEEYGFREYDISKFATTLMVNEYAELGSHIKSKLANRAYDAVNKLRFGDAKKVYFIKYGQMCSIEGADNRQAIRYRDGYIEFRKLRMPAMIKSNDIYAQKALQDRIKYCRFLKKSNKYYIQLILEGIPPVKINKETGEIKGQIGCGKVGIDIGTQTIAYASQYEVGLKELAPEIQNIDKEIKLLQRKMDRSKRIINPNKYNKNGTINIKNKDKWIYSNHYKIIREQVKELYRKQTEIRKQSHNILANNLIILGKEFYVENMNYKSLQARSKRTQKNARGKSKKKKRFGKSLVNKAPAMFLEIMNNKLKWNGTKLYKIDTYSVKASQYNHITNEYKKKELGERWNDFGEFKIQRDLYSAFLIMNVKNNLKEINRDMCFETFDNFKELHDNEIKRIKNSNNKLISSMGL